MKRLRINIQEWIYVLMATLMLVGATVFPNFATDTYATFTHPEDAIVLMITKNGRPVIALMYKIIDCLGISNVATINIYTITGFICLYISIILYEDSLRKYIKNDLLRCLVATLTISNIYIAEFMMFLEKVAFMLAILFSVIAYRCFKRIIENETRNKILDYAYSLLCLIIAVCTYQPVVSLFVVLTLPFILRKQYLWKNKIMWGALTALMYGSVGIMNLIILVAVGSQRVNNTESIFERLKMFIILPRNCIGMFEIVPKYFWIIIVITIMFLCISAAKCEEKKTVIGHMLLISLGVEVCALSTIIIGSGWLSPRVIYVVASLPMIIIVFGFTNEVFVDTDQYSFSTINKILVGVITIYLVVSSIGTDNVYREKYITNALDEYRCYMIGDAISNYEEITGIEIKKIAYYEDAHLDGYEEIFTTNPVFRTSSFDTYWSDVRALQYYLNREFERCKGDVAIASEFATKDWKIFSANQLRFDGDTLHICRY